MDTQLVKRDEILPMSSGLDIYEAMGVLTGYSFEQFEDYMLSITTKSSGSISAKTASEIAARLITGILKPIAAQIDPMRLGEASRAITIAREYGKRLGAASSLHPGGLESLVERYPSHGFVIDLEEAQKIFRRMGKMTDVERQLCIAFRAAIRYPAPEATSADLGATARKKKIGDNNGSGEAPSGTPDPPKDDATGPEDVAPHDELHAGTTEHSGNGNQGGSATPEPAQASA